MGSGKTVGSRMSSESHDLALKMPTLLKQLLTE